MHKITVEDTVNTREFTKDKLYEVLKNVLDSNAKWQVTLSLAKKRRQGQQDKEGDSNCIEVQT